MARGRFALIGGLVALVVLAILALASIYVVDPTKNAIVLRFGQPVTVTSEPGLYFKVPLIDNVVFIERRLLDINSPAVEFANQDGRLVVDAFARYRIEDPLQFYTSTSSGNLGVANSRLSDILSSTIRNVLAPSNFQATVSQDRSALMAQITTQVNAQAAELGVSVVDVRIRRADLPDAIRESVFQRMRTLWQTQAAQIRAEGEEQYRTTVAVADATVTRTIAVANQQSETIRGDGDAQANRIFAEAYGLDPDFFSFYRSMIAYQEGLTPTTTTMVLAPDSAFFRFFNQFAPIPGAAEQDLVLPPVEVPEVEVPEVEPGAVPLDPAMPGLPPELLAPLPDPALPTPQAPEPTPAPAREAVPAPTPAPEAVPAPAPAGP
ncbi:MAG: protease modulator HflC [Bauldia sp.]